MTIGQYYAQVVKIELEKNASVRLSEIASRYGITAPKEAIEDMLRNDWKALSVFAHALHGQQEKDTTNDTTN